MLDVTTADWELTIEIRPQTRLFAVRMLRADQPIPGRVRRLASNPKKLVTEHAPWK